MHLNEKKREKPKKPLQKKESLEHYVLTPKLLHTEKANAKTLSSASQRKI